MIGDRQKTILISEPQSIGALPYLPYMWGVLKTYCEREAGLDGAFRWLNPIYDRATAEQLLSPYDGVPVDVIGLSCYMWNWSLQCRLAQLIKERWPDCLVVAGGPHPDYKDPAFFEKHPFIDVIVVQDGEIAFSKILCKVLAHDRDFADIPGLVLPNPNAPWHLATGKAELPTHFEHSPYLEQRTYYEPFIARYADGVQAVWETNRGCPYACSFCDWGSNTMSKVRRFDMARIFDEVDWFGHTGLRHVLSVDANFGIFPRDLEIADRICDVHKQYGAPDGFYYSPAKNNPGRTGEIAKKLHEAMATEYPLALQHTREEVLKCVDRSNISVEKQLASIEGFKANGVRVIIQLIMGMPGDTYDLWKACLTDLMEFGLHHGFEFYHFNLLPNAPASSDDYRKEWQLETFRRYAAQFNMPRHKSGLSKHLETYEVVASKTYTRKDWVKMATFAHIIVALHNFSLTKRIAQYLRLTHDVSYVDFYSVVVEEFLADSDVLESVKRVFEIVLDDDLPDADRTFEMEVEGIPEVPYLLEPSQWAAVQICMTSERFYADLGRFLVDRYQDIDGLASVVDYQRNVIVLPNYDHRQGGEFSTDLDWPAYFKTADELVGHRALDEPAPLPHGRVQIADSVFGPLKSSFSWVNEVGRMRWAAWIRVTLCCRRGIRNLELQDMRVVAGDDALAGGQTALPTAGQARSFV